MKNRPIISESDSQQGRASLFSSHDYKGIQEDIKDKVKDLFFLNISIYCTCDSGWRNFQNISAKFYKCRIFTYVNINRLHMATYKVLHL